MRVRGGKITVSTSLAQRDLERLFFLAAKDHVSVSTWLRRATIKALDSLIPGVELEELACACGDLPSQHGPQGCSKCRCPKYRAKP